MTDNHGGIHISLEDEMRKEKEATLAQEERDQKLKEENEKKMKETRISELYWAYNLYVLGSGPAFLSLITLLSGPYVHKVENRCQKYNLEIFLQLTIVIAYVYLFLYAWMLFGPYPFHSTMKYLKRIFAGLAFISTGIYSYGFYLVSVGKGCRDNSSAQYNYCQMQLLFFVVGSICVIYKLSNDYYEDYSERKKKEKRLKMKQAIMDDIDEENEDDDEDEEEEDEEKGDEEGENKNENPEHSEGIVEFPEGQVTQPQEEQTNESILVEQQNQ